MLKITLACTCCFTSSVALRHLSEDYITINEPCYEKTNVFACVWVDAFESTVNSCGHVGTVSYPIHTVPGQASPKQVTSTKCTTFHH